MSPYRLTDVEKADVKEEMLSLMIDLAKHRKVVTYSEFCGLLQTVTLHPHSFIFARLLDEVCGDAYERGYGMLCALIVSKATGMPSAGYFRRRIPLEANDRTPEQIWQEERDSVFAQWEQET